MSVLLVLQCQCELCVPWWIWKIVKSVAVSPDDPCGHLLIPPDLVRCDEVLRDLDSAAATRSVTKIIPAASRRWRRWIDIDGLFLGPGDPLPERAELAYDVRDPWNF